MQALYPLSIVLFLSSCVVKKPNEALWQLIPDSGVSIPKEAASDLELSEELVKRVCSKENLPPSQVLAGKNIESTIILRDDWHSKALSKLGQFGLGIETEWSCCGGFCSVNDQGDKQLTYSVVTIPVKLTSSVQQFK